MALHPAETWGKSLRAYIFMIFNYFSLNPGGEAAAPDVCTFCANETALYFLLRLGIDGRGMMTPVTSKISETCKYQMCYNMYIFGNHYYMMICFFKWGEKKNEKQKNMDKAGTLNQLNWTEPLHCMLQNENVYWDGRITWQLTVTSEMRI